MDRLAGFQINTAAFCSTGDVQSASAVVCSSIGLWHWTYLTTVSLPGDGFGPMVEPSKGAPCLHRNSW